MTEELSAFSNDLYKSVNLNSFRKIIFKVGTCLNPSLILQSFNLNIRRDKRRSFNRFFQQKITF